MVTATPPSNSRTSTVVRLLEVLLVGAIHLFVCFHLRKVQRRLEHIALDVGDVGDDVNVRDWALDYPDGK